MQIGEFQVGQKIGEGAFSKVHLCTRQGSSEELVMKIMKKDESKNENDRAVIQLAREVQVLSQLNHPNIVKYYQFFEDDSNSYIIMEYIEGQSLLDFINGHPQQDQRVCQNIFFQICKAILYLHEKGIAHRDLKLDNIMIDVQYRVKLLDFGLCNFNNSSKLMTTFCGSLCNAAPEILMKIPYDGFKADMWSLGVILYSIMTKTLPWPMNNAMAMIESIKNAVYAIPTFVPPFIEELIRGLLRLDPDERLDIHQVLENKWLSLENRYGVEISPLQTVSLTQLPSLHHPTRRKQRRCSALDSTVIVSHTPVPSNSNVATPTTIIRPVAQQPSVLVQIQSKIRNNQLRVRSSSVRPFNLPSTV